MELNLLDLFTHHPQEYSMILDLTNYNLNNIIPNGKEHSLLMTLILIFVLLLSRPSSWGPNLEY